MLRMLAIRYNFHKIGPARGPNVNAPLNARLTNISLLPGLDRVRSSGFSMSG